MITDSARYYGAVFSFVIDNWSGSVAIRKAFDDIAGLYIINEVMPLFIKYSTRRRGPWSFTFQRDHQERQKFLSDVHGECIIALVCGRDGSDIVVDRDGNALLAGEVEDPEQRRVIRARAFTYR